MTVPGENEVVLEETSASLIPEGATIEETSRDTLPSNNEESITMVEIGSEECQILLECLQRKRQELMQSHPM